MAENTPKFSAKMKVTFGKKTFKNNKQGAKEKENKQDTTDIITKSKITDK